MQADRPSHEIGRRDLVALGLAAAAIVAAPARGHADQGTASSAARRRLGGLEVSSIGLGVQNMHRTYQTHNPLPARDAERHSRRP